MNEDKATRYHRLGRRAGVLSTLWSGVMLVAAFCSRAHRSGLRAWAAGHRRRRIPHSSSRCTSSCCRSHSMPRRSRSASIGASYSSVAMASRRETIAALAEGSRRRRRSSACCSPKLAPLFVYFTLRHWPGMVGACRRRRIPLVAIVLVNLAPVVLLPLFFTFKPLEKDALRDRLDGARVEGRHANHGRLRVDAQRSHQEGERRADRHGPHAANSSVGHAARRLLRRRDRSHPRARARASRAPGHLDVGASSTWR